MTDKSIYLASGYGFSTLERATLLPLFKRELKSLKLAVFEPFEKNNFRGLSPHEVGQLDVWAIKNLDAVFAIINGEPPDAGVMYEIGLAHGLGKPVFTFRDEGRVCSDAASEYPVNPMAFAQHTVEGAWRDSHHTSLVSITDKSKALYKWAKARG